MSKKTQYIIQNRKTRKLFSYKIKNKTFLEAFLYFYIDKIKNFIHLSKLFTIKGFNSFSNGL